jgi:hypothetical protein
MGQRRVWRPSRCSALFFRYGYVGINSDALFIVFSKSLKQQNHGFNSHSYSFEG